MINIGKMVSYFCFLNWTFFSKTMLTVPFVGDNSDVINELDTAHQRYIFINFLQLNTLMKTNIR